MQPALGHSLRSAIGTSTTPCTTPPLPPSPLLPPTVARPPYPIVENVKIDLEKLRADTVDALSTVEKIWDLELASDAGQIVSEEQTATSPVDVLELLKASVDAIRSVRAYSMALPSSMLPSSSSSSKPTLRVPSTLGRARQSLSTPSRPAPRSVSSSGSVTSNFGSTTAIAEEDPLAEVRKAALEVLTGLRALEERSRVEDVASTLPSRDGQAVGGELDVESAAPAQDLAGHSRDDQQHPRITLQSEDNEDEEDLSFFFPTESEDQTGVPKDSWYDRLNDADREGWLYRTDMTIGIDLLEERRLVQAWLRAVDRRIVGQGAGSRGSAFSSRRNSSSSVQDVLTDTETEGKGLTWLDPDAQADPLGELEVVRACRYPKSD